MNETKPPWDQDVPVHLRPALKALRQRFEDGRWKVGQLTQVLAFACLHGEKLENLRDYLMPLKQLKLIIGPAATQRFHHYVKGTTVSSIFKAFWDLLLDGMKAEITVVFGHVLEIARANETQLGVDSQQWAQARVERMVDDEAHTIEDWVRSVCDKQDRKMVVDDPDEWIFWRSWQAPWFLIMQPAGPQKFEGERIWERQDVATSMAWLRHFSGEYKISLKTKLHHAVGEAAVSAAKRPIPTPTSSPPGSNNGEPHTVAGKINPTDLRRAKQKRATQKRHAAWAKQYAGLKAKYPGKSDVWYSRKIATMEIGQGVRPETIRKNMK